MADATYAADIKMDARYSAWSSLNNPAAQAAGADPSQFNFTNSQNPPLQQNCHNTWPNNAIVIPFGIWYLLSSIMFYFMTESTISNRLGVTAP